MKAIRNKEKIHINRKNNNKKNRRDRRRTRGHKEGRNKAPGQSKRQRGKKCKKMK